MNNDAKKNPMDADVAVPELGVPTLSVNPSPQPEPADGKEKNSDGARVSS